MLNIAGCFAVSFSELYFAILKLLKVTLIKMTVISKEINMDCVTFF